MFLLEGCCCDLPFRDNCSSFGDALVLWQLRDIAFDLRAQWEKIDSSLLRQGLPKRERLTKTLMQQHSAINHKELVLCLLRRAQVCIVAPNTGCAGNKRAVRATQSTGLFGGCEPIQWLPVVVIELELHPLGWSFGNHTWPTFPPEVRAPYKSPSWEWLCEYILDPFYFSASTSHCGSEKNIAIISTQLYSVHKGGSLAPNCTISGQTCAWLTPKAKYAWRGNKGGFSYGSYIPFDVCTITAPRTRHNTRSVCTCVTLHHTAN